MEYRMTDKDIIDVVKPFMGKIAWPTILGTILASSAYILVLIGAITGALPTLAAIALLGFLVYVMYTPLHEAVHNNMAGSNPDFRWLNNTLGYLAATILGVSFTMHRSAHLAHHRATNLPGEDPDLCFKDSSLFSAITGGTLTVVNEYKTYFTRVFPRAKTTEKIVVMVEIITFLAWRLALAFAGFPLEALLFTVIANFVGVTVISYVFAYLVHTPFGETDRYKNTNTIIMPAWIHRPVTFLWLWQNYHSIHHLFPRVPFYQYAKIFDQIEPGMIERGAPIIYLSRKGQELAIN